MAVMSSRARGQRNEKQSRQPHSYHPQQQEKQLHQKEVEKVQRELEGPKVNQKFVVVDSVVVPPKVHFDEDKPKKKSKDIPPLPISSSSTTSVENKERKKTTHPLEVEEEEEDEYRKRGLIVYPFTYSLISAATSCSLPSSLTYRPETSRIIDIDKSVVGASSSSTSIPTTTTSTSTSSTAFTTYTTAFPSPSSIFYAVSTPRSISKTKSVDILGSPSILKSFRELDEPTRFSNSRTRTPLNIYTPPPSRVQPLPKNRVKGNLATTTKKSPLESPNGQSNVSSAVSESENHPTSPKEGNNTVSIRQIRESLATKRKQDIKKNISKSEEALVPSSSKSSTNMPLRVRMRRDEYYYTESSSKATQTDEKEFNSEGKEKEKSSRRTSVCSSGRRKSSTKYIVEKVDRSTSPIFMDSTGNGGSGSGSRRQSVSSSAYLKKLEDLEKITGHFVIQRFFTKTDQEFGLWLEQQLQQASIPSSSSILKGISESRPESNVGFILDRVPEKTSISTIPITTSMNTKIIETPATSTITIGNIFPQPLVLPPITQINHKSLHTPSQIQSQTLDQTKQKGQTENTKVPLEKRLSKTILTTSVTPTTITTTTTDAAKITTSTNEDLSVSQVPDKYPSIEKKEETNEEKLPAVPKIPCYLLSNPSTTTCTSSIPCTSNSVSVPPPHTTSSSSVSSVLTSISQKMTPSPSSINASTNVTKEERTENEKEKLTEKEKQTDTKPSLPPSPSSSSLPLKQDESETTELSSISTKQESLDLEKAPKITEQPRPGVIDEIELETIITKTTITPTTKTMTTEKLVEEVKKSETSLTLKEEKLHENPMNSSAQSIDKLEAEIIVKETPPKTTTMITTIIEKPPDPDKQDKDKQSKPPESTLITVETKVTTEEKEKALEKVLEKVEIITNLNEKEIVESFNTLKEHAEFQQEQQQQQQQPRQCKKDDLIPCECFVKFFLQEENIAKLLISLSPRTSTPLISPKDDIKEEEISHMEKQSEESNKPKIQKEDTKLADEVTSKSTIKTTTLAKMKTDMDPLESFEKFEAALQLSKSKSQGHIQLPVRIPSAKKQNNNNNNNTKPGKLLPRKIKHSESLPVDVTKSTTTAMLTTTTTILTMDHNDHKFHFQQYTNSNRNLGQSESYPGLRKSLSVDSCLGTVSTDLSSIKTASNDSGVHHQDHEKFLIENLNMSQDSHQSMSIGVGGTTSAVLLLEEEIVSNKDSGLGGSSGRSNSQWFDDHDNGHSVSFTRREEDDDEVIITPTTMMLLESQEVEEFKNKAKKVQPIEEQQQQHQMKTKQNDDNIIDEVQIYSADSDSESEIVISENYHAGSDEEIEEDVAGEDGDDDETTGAEALALSQIPGQIHGSNKAGDTGGRDDNTDVDILDDDDDDDDNEQDNNNDLLARIELDELRLEMDMNMDDDNNDKPLARIRNTCTQTNRSLFSSAWSNATSATSSSTSSASSATTTTGGGGSYIDLEVISNKIQTTRDGNSGELQHAKRNYLPSSSSSLNFVNCNMNFSVKNDESKFRMSLTLPGAATSDIRGINRQSFMHRHHHQLQKKLHSQRKSLTHGESKYKGENDLPSLWANVKDRLDSKVSLTDGQQPQMHQKEGGESGTGEDDQLIVGGSRATINKSKGESRSRGRHREKSQRPSHQNLPQQQSHFVRSTGHNNHSNDDRIKRSLERLSKLLDIEKKQ